MTSLIASAPGKVILCGEYAVLDGAPAISMALDRRAVVTVTPASNGGSGLETIGLADTTDRSLFDCAVVAAGNTKTDEYSFVLDTSKFSDAGSARKFGIGSSAALMVALCRALAGDKTRDSDVCEIAATAHWAFQGGTGSGVDIATSVAGGLIEFQMAGNAVTGLSWPSGLTFALLWSGVPVSSKERVDKLSKGVEKQSRKTLSVAAATAAAAWKSGDADVVMTAHGDYGDALRFTVRCCISCVEIVIWPCRSLTRRGQRTTIGKRSKSRSSKALKRYCCAPISTFFDCVILRAWVAK